MEGWKAGWLDGWMAGWLDGWMERGTTGSSFAAFPLPSIQSFTPNQP
jgi:hypothetical protein